jgi:hypothetical protein
LFYETNTTDKSQILYTLKDTDHNGYPSLYRLYMEAGDLTEYSFAIQHLDGWNHWETLCKSPWFQDYLARWRRELELKYRSAALKNLIDAANGDSRDALQANKFLIQGHWKSGEGSGRGRPSKEEIKSKAHELASEAVKVDEDYKRLFN